MYDSLSLASPDRRPQRGSLDNPPVPTLRHGVAVPLLSEGEAQGVLRCLSYGCVGVGVDEDDAVTL